MEDFFNAVMSMTMDLYNMESPFFGLTFFEIIVGFFVISLCIRFFRAFFGFPAESEKSGFLKGVWGDKSYTNKGGSND